MSSSSPDMATTASASVSATGTIDDADPSASVSSNLYLFTFLATLFLLLVVSCLVVLRSFVMRRRFRRRVNHALQEGMILAPHVQGSRRKRFGAKPKLHDTWLISGGDTWDSMMPMSVQRLRVKRKTRKDHQRMSLPPTPPPSRDPLFWNPFRSLQPPVLSLAPPSTEGGEKEDLLKICHSCGNIHPTTTEMLQISVLIAMPSQDRSPHFKDKDADSLDTEYEPEEIPDVAIGVTRLPFKLPRPAGSESGPS